MISIIIIVKNDRGIKNTLKKLAKILKPEKTEIIVVDASEKEILVDIRKKFPRVRWIYFHNKTGEKITIPEQRNLGIKKSKGDIIVFIDANCIPDKNWLIELIRPIKEGGENYVTGAVGSIGGKSIYDLTWRKIKEKKYRGDAGSANTAFKKKLISKVGFFDETFDYGSDMDFVWRVIDKGYKIRYCPRAVIYHDWGNLNQEIKRAFRYGKARVRLYRKHKNRLKKIFRSDFVTLAYPIYILFIPITFFWPYYLLFILVPIIKNFKRSPLKVVLVNLITGLGILKELFFPSKINNLNKK